MFHGVETRTTADILVTHFLAAMDARNLRLKVIRNVELKDTALLEHLAAHLAFISFDIAVRHLFVAMQQERRWKCFLAMVDLANERSNACS